MIDPSNGRGMRTVLAEYRWPKRGMMFKLKTRARRDSSPDSPGGAEPELCVITGVVSCAGWSTT